MLRVGGRAQDGDVRRAGGRAEQGTCRTLWLLMTMSALAPVVLSAAVTCHPRHQVTVVLSAAVTWHRVILDPYIEGGAPILL